MCNLKSNDDNFPAKYFEKLRKLYFKSLFIFRDTGTSIQFAKGLIH